MATSGHGVRASQGSLYDEDASDAELQQQQKRQPLYQDDEEPLSVVPSTAPSMKQQESLPEPPERAESGWEVEEGEEDDYEQLEGPPPQQARRSPSPAPRTGSPPVGQRKGAAPTDAWPTSEPDSPQANPRAAAAAAGGKGRNKKGNRQEPPVYEGDLSEWGRAEVEGFYDEEDDQSAASVPTLSSGVGPRGPSAKPFDLLAAKETLAYNAGMFSRAQAMRREGTAPAAMGVADDLPTRMAYQQLHILAGMAGKVQNAILHNKRIFEQRMKQEDRALQRKVLQSWRLRCCASAQKEAKLRKAVGKITKGTMARAFYAWRDAFHLVDKNFAMKRKLAVVIARGLLRRTWEAWRLQCRERYWKNQYLLREREVVALEAKIRGYERRPIQVLRKRRMRAMLLEWFGLARERRARRLRGCKAARHFGQSMQVKAWNTWRERYLETKRRAVLVKKVAGRIGNLQMASAWAAWRDLLASKHEMQGKLSRSMKFWTHASVAKSFNSWVAYVRHRKEVKRIGMRWMQPAKARAFTAWMEHVAWRKRSRLLVGRALAQLHKRVMVAAFDAWREHISKSHLAKTQSSREDMQSTLTDLQAQNERLRRDNERFVRLIDSGEWGRGRVAELVTAGEVMQSERDALLKLISSLRREYEAVQTAKGAQEEELRSLKERLSVGGPARNRMLVKGGSSFNALVRAMKQDLIEAGTTAKDPTLLYEIDKLSMERVQVFPDGELNVTAVSSGASPGASGGLPTFTGRSGTPTARKTGSPGPVSRLGTAGMSGLASGGAMLSSITPTGASSTSPLRPGAQTGASMAAGTGNTQQILAALQSLSPAEVDRLERAVKQDPRSSGGGVVGSRRPR